MDVLFLWFSAFLIYQLMFFGFFFIKVFFSTMTKSKESNFSQNNLEKKIHQIRTKKVSFIHMFCLIRKINCIFRSCP